MKVQELPTFITKEMVWLQVKTFPVPPKFTKWIKEIRAIKCLFLGFRIKLFLKNFILIQKEKKWNIMSWMAEKVHISTSDRK